MQLQISPITLIIVLAYVSGLAFSIGRIYEQLRQAKQESRRTKHAPDGARIAPHCVHGYNGTCPECGAMQTPPRR